MRLVLASASPRRAELLRAAGFDFEVVPADIDESMDVEETPDGYVRRVAQLKAQAIAARVPGSAVLGADTVVIVDYDVLGKPADTAEARRMLQRLSGREHVVITAVCLISEGGAKRIQTGLARTTVEFAALSSEEIDWYIRSGEPMDKAGAYAVQGRASRFITRVDGSYSNVVGLPIAVVYGLCRQAGLLIS